MPKKTSSWKKVTDSSTTRSKAKKKRQKELSDSLASLSFPVKTCSTRNPKKLPTVSEDLKQAVVISPECEKGTIAQVVTKKITQNKHRIK